MIKVVLVAIVAGFALLASPPASATFSIVACDSKNCGAAVATNNLAVGATVIYAKAGVGAVASQFETNPSYGLKGLALLEAGRGAEAALSELLRTDDGFEGQDISFRQVGIVGIVGKGAAYTGEVAAGSPWAGMLTGPGYSIQGNGLAGHMVLEAMRERFLKTRGTLADRLMAALEAGQAAGGQTTGRLSAALLVRTSEGGFQDIDLRVDAADQPIPALHRLLGMHEANDEMVRAERALHSGHIDAAKASLADAVRLGAGWDRIWRRAARLEMSMGDKGAALQALAAFASINPVWARSELDDPVYASLWQNADAVEWRQGLR
ncbi:DUF1028 domain-containing protein [Sphingomonas sp. QA11]|uniref:DUF1028 domain-containing protein n=1 Tax=Sphingomonas sp. QA11 TaxID=2950605 RepID=UPI00234AC9BD|nr:DUF1028 domain-containing protein [Sphingomonas sp. QA11]WCM25905.1 DUF1028 domain-containing protein [Sphingomonas sp. QA11]